MKNIIIGLITGIILATGTVAIAAPSVFVGKAINTNELPVLNIGNTKKIFYSSAGYVTKFSDGQGTCYIYNGANGVAMSCLK
jgi:hypothetical protein